jgi:hypothetical protein
MALCVQGREGDADAGDAGADAERTRTRERDTFGDDYAIYRRLNRGVACRLATLEECVTLLSFSSFSAG